MGETEMGFIKEEFSSCAVVVVIVVICKILCKRS